MPAARCRQRQRPSRCRSSSPAGAGGGRYLGIKFALPSLLRATKDRPRRPTTADRRCVSATECAPATEVVGQGNLDAIVGILGMMCGSYLFAVASKHTSGTVSRWGQRGKITLPDVVGLSPGVFIILAVPVLVGVLIVLEMFFP